ncbi:ataxin-7-like protein 1 isoform X2 [Odontomachus brunneus]|uniref:ataxin-7-like protein 1 isoform X2 n=1 Tax=Odontomachus brunneus TaxID=486640 RepID=UPI0013F21A92|nr:ataxin-7-like protein 1 isoform X2 [Odontomachus brunneus]
MSGSDSPTFFHGQPWSSWIERIGRDKPLSDEETDAQPSSSVTRLSVEDIDLYGFCPERDLFYGVVCEICNAIVKPQALIQHMESRHPSGTANFPPPLTPTVKPTVKIPYCKVSKLKKSQTPTPTIPVVDVNTKLNHTAVKRNVEQTNLSAGSGSLPISSSPRSPLESITVQTTTSSNVTGPPVVTSSPSKSPVVASIGQPRRKRLKADRSLLKDREYDPDRHCGVWNEETGKPCTRSLTCKAHTVSLRRTVVGRSKTFDKLLAEHRAAKEQPSGSGRATTKVTVAGTVTVSSVAASSLNPHAPNTPVSTAEPEAPSSPPVLSLPDSYPLPKTKLEEDFANAEELRNLESTLVNSSAASAAVAVVSSASQQPSSMMAPISVILPSLSPLPGNSEESPVATLIPSTTTAAMPIVPAPLPATCVQPPAVVATVLEGETPVDIDAETISATMYSPVYTKDTKSQLVMQAMSRPNSHRQQSQSPVQSARSYQIQASMPSLGLFDPVEQLEQQHASQINGKRLNHASSVVMSSRQQKKHKPHDYQSSQDFTTTTTSIQVEATTTSSPYPHFGDISWSNCHPEPLAVSRWLRISSSRKQYNFNIH